MRSDRGYFCLPEIDLKLPFQPGMVSLIQSKLLPQTAVAGHDDRAALHSRGRESRTDRAGHRSLRVAPDLACNRSRSLAGKDRATLASIKTALFSSVVESLNGRLDRTTDGAAPVRATNDQWHQKADSGMSTRSAGRTAIITGTSRGTGLVIAERSVGDGARVGVTARKPDALAEAFARLGVPRPPSV